MLVSKLYSRKLLPINHVNEIVQDITSYYSSILLEPLKTICRDFKSEESQEVQNILNIAEQAFQPLRTEYLTFKHFENLGCLIKPIDNIVIDTSIKARRIGGKKIHYQ